MIFNGIKVSFNCKNGQQYETIGVFWKYMSDIYPNDTLKGVCYNWRGDYLDYIIGDFTLARDYNMPTIKESYPDAEYVEINLPEEGWEVYQCKISELSKLYEEIYKNGKLSYEIEEIDSDGNCTISIIRKKI